MSKSIVLHNEHFFAYPRSFLKNEKFSAKSFGKVAVLLGGDSTEREVSLESGKNVLAALKNKHVNAHAIDATGDYIKKLIDGHFDRVFLILHGKYGEDGCVQGALESLGLPYTGSGVAASALAMDKPRAKLILNALDLPTPKFGIAYDLFQAIEISKKINFPMAVKPVSEGSSVGTYCVNESSELENAFNDARQYGPVLLEPWIFGKDFFVSVIGDEALPSVQVQVQDKFYDYEAKYKSDKTQYFCPAPITQEQEYEVRKLAKQSFYALGCSGWGRVDFVLDNQGKFWILEVNTIPGMTHHSLVPLSAKAVGLGFEDLVLNILSTTLEQSQEMSMKSTRVAGK